MTRSHPRPLARRVAPRVLGLVAALAVALTALTGLGSVLGSTAAHAVPIPAGPFSIEIHKYEQPDQLGQPGNGLPLDPGALPSTAPVEGATFTATRVPGIDVTTNSGQQAAQALTVAAARAAVAGLGPDATDTTDALGSATLGDPALGTLVAGLYFVEETVTPDGFVGAADFLVMLPLTDPDTRDSWLSTVHVYPKNDNVGAGTVLQVSDEDVWACHDPVTWTPVSSIPGTPTISGYIVQNLLDPGLALVGTLADVTVQVTGVAVDPGTDYIVRSATIDGREAFEVAFTATGRQKLVDARAADPDARVTLGYRTIVLSDQPGEFTNEMRLLPSAAAIDGAGVVNVAYLAAPQPGGALTSTATVKFGALLVIVEEQGNSGNRIPGATIQLFRTEADAAARANPIECAGETSWVSGSNGEVLIPCLRLSNFENGAQLAPDSPRIRHYWAAMTQLPAGWTGSTAGFPVQVLSTSILHPTVAEVFLVRGGGGGGGGLPITGAQITGIVMLSILLVGGGAMVLLRRRDRDEEERAGERTGA